MTTKTALSSVPLHDLIANRWSPRAIAADKAVSKTDLLALLEAARWSPSCFNDQPWRFVVFDKNTDLASWEIALSVLVEKNQLWAKNAPVLILSVAMANFNHNGTANRWSGYDTGAATMSLSLQATALGLVVHQMGGFDGNKARELFALPEDCTPMAMLAVGYQGEVDDLADDFKAAETAERSRKPLAEQFFAGKWGVEV